MSKKRKKELLLIVPRLDLKDPILAFLYFWVEEFVKQADKVTVIALKGSEEEKRKIEKAGGRVYLLNSIPKPLKLIKIAQIMFKEKRRYSVVLSFMYPELAIVSGFTGKVLGKRRGMYYAHGSISLKLWIATLLSDVIVTTSKEGFRLNTLKKKVLSQGINLDLFKRDHKIKRENIILYVGRISRIKRLNIFIELAKLDMLKGWKFWIIGPVIDNEYYLELKRKSKGLNIFFLGSVPYKEMPYYYNKARIFINPSKTGSLDKTVLEAWACDLTVFTSNEAYIPLLGENDKIFYFNDKEELVNNLTEFLKSREALRHRNKVLPHTYERYISNLLKLL